MATKSKDRELNTLVQQCWKVLDEAQLSWTDKRRVIAGLSHLNDRSVRDAVNGNDDLNDWRRKRLETGPVGSSKKTEELRSELARNKKQPGRRK